MSNAIPRLFSKNEIDEAIDFIAEDAAKSRIISMDIDSESASEVDDADKLRIIRHIFRSSYGINAPLIANYLTVQNTFMDKYIDNITKYLDYTGHSSYVMTINPSPITVMVLNNRAKNGKLQNPLSYWNPNTEWDLEATSTDCDRNLLSPINGFIQLYLYIDKVTSIDFITDILERPSDRNRLIQRIKSEVSTPLNLKLLPRKDFKPLLNTIDAIHKYF